MHADPVAHAAEHYSHVDSYQESMEREVSRLKTEFYQSVMTRTLTDHAGFGHTSAWNGSYSVKVPATVLDVLMNAVDHRDNYSVIFGALVACARKDNADALSAIHQLAGSYADMNAELPE